MCCWPQVQHQAAAGLAQPLRLERLDQLARQLSQWVTVLAVTVCSHQMVAGPVL